MRKLHLHFVVVVCGAVNSCFFVKASLTNLIISQFELFVIDLIFLGTGQTLLAKRKRLVI